MSKSNDLETELLSFIFNAATPTWSGAADIYVSLHTADPGESGNQATSEATYSGYTRIAVARDSGGWTVTGDHVTNTAPIQFPVSSGTTNTITHIGIGRSLSGSGELFYRAAMSTPHVVVAASQPTISAGAIVITED